MSILGLLFHHYPAGHPAREALLRHSLQVAGKARSIAEKLAASHPVDIVFAEEAALLHDIGILHTHAPGIGCHGSHPYLAHGYLGRQMLEDAGLPRHALVCERHIGVGLSRRDVIDQGLPLPQREMTPQSIEEEIVAYADLFFSKSDTSHRERSPETIRRKLERFGPGKVAAFDNWHRLFA